MAEEHVRAAIEGALPVGRAAAAGAEAEGRRRRGGLPEDCPVTPLGVKDDHSYYLDAARQLRALKAGEHGRMHIQHLFGAEQAWLWKTWPSYNREGEQTGWNSGAAGAALVEASFRAGIWDPEETERGPGAWAGPSGELILHVGDGVLVGRGGRLEPGEYPPGLLGGHVYPGAPPQPRPEALDDLPPDRAAGELLAMLETWPWKREINARLLLGWIAAAMVGGALDWRPMAWITGGSGSGKSTLQKLIGLVLGGGLVSASEATGAGIRQAVERSSLPVSLDEAEPDEGDHGAMQRVIRLARQAASGGLVLRGGDNHKGRRFTVRSCFLFSSIVVPPLDDQDRSRMALLDLDRFPAGAPAPKLDAGRWNRIGQALRWRLQVRWHLAADLIETYKVQMAETGWDSRGADQFGTLLGLADLVQWGAEPDAEQAAVLVELLGTQIREDRTAVEYAMLDHLLQTPVDPWRKGERRMMAEWIARAAGPPWSDEYYRAEDDFDGQLRSEAEKALAMHGLKVETARLDPADELPGLVMWIANRHRGLAEIFQGTGWGGRAGALGVWRQLALRLPGARASANAVYYRGGGTIRSVGVPIATVLGPPPD